MPQLKFYKQERENSCSAACLRMMLDYYGIVESESVLCKKMKLKPFGIHPLAIIECAHSYGLQAYFLERDFSKVVEYVNRGMPIIVNLLYETEEIVSIHSVVVHKATDSDVQFFDPEFGAKSLPKENFIGLWSDAGELAILITPQ
jgi:ABC-type bacteriocin/lantibiotic exporter with double-glycine peptidase domain